MANVTPLVKDLTTGLFRPIAAGDVITDEAAAVISIRSLLLSGGVDAFLSSEIIEAICKGGLRFGATTLTLGAVPTDGQILVRSGAALTGQDVGEAAAVEVGSWTGNATNPRTISTTISPNFVMVFKTNAGSNPGSLIPTLTASSFSAVDEGLVIGTGAFQADTVYDISGASFQVNTVYNTSGVVYGYLAAKT